jgi:dihydropteroate synthase-like protein
LHFITGRLAERALREVLAELAPRVGFEYTIQVLNITVAALMTPAWIAARVEVPESADKVIIPGYADGDLAPLQAAVRVPVERGPRDLRRLPEYFGQKACAEEYGAYDIQIVAEINNAPRFTHDEILRQARALAADGADLIDLGCDPGGGWSNVGDAVKLLRDAGLRVSIDSLRPDEIAPAVRAGAELVLSVNSSNRAAARDWGCEVVAIPDTPDDLASLDATVEYLATHGVPLRIDPILEPIGFGFAKSLQRYMQVRERYPEAEMFMGIGNLTELTDADSAGINVMLLAICQELGIRGVLTTQVINWARNSVRECDLARRLVAYSIDQRRLPKHREPRLIPLRGNAPREYGAEVLAQLAAEIKDHNYRIFAERGELHLLSAQQHLQGSDPFEIFARLLATKPTNMDAGHAFYLGYEMCKAMTALTLHKHYEQDEALDWGYLTREENSHRLQRQKSAKYAEQTEPEVTRDA